MQDTKGVDAGLLQSRYRLTKQRAAILRALEDGRHLSAETILERVRAQLPGVSLGTIYRTLDILRSIGLVQIVLPRRRRGQIRSRAGKAPSPGLHAMRRGDQRQRDRGALALAERSRRSTASTTSIARSSSPGAARAARTALRAFKDECRFEIDARRDFAEGVDVDARADTLEELRQHRAQRRGTRRRACGRDAGVGEIAPRRSRSRGARFADRGRDPLAAPHAREFGIEGRREDQRPHARDAVAAELLRHDARRTASASSRGSRACGAASSIASNTAIGSRGHTRSRSSSANARCARDDRQHVGADVLHDRRARSRADVRAAFGTLGGRTARPRSRARSRRGASRRSRSHRTRARRRLRALAFRRHDRLRAQAVDRLAARLAVDVCEHGVGRDGQQPIEPQPAFARDAIAHANRVRVGRAQPSSRRRTPGITIPVSAASARRTSPMRSSSASALGGASSG